MIRTLLIANRGEIACRVARTARSMGIRTVAVFSEADVGALHVESCDAAVPIGPAPAAESYLRGEVVIEAARASGADAVHPGYGFLSENAGFAEACAEAGIIFVGPPAKAIQAMGSKAEAKALMENAGVPLVPGYHGASQDLAILTGAAEKIGYPVLLKASAGGGGRGMRVVEAAEELEAAIVAAKRESASAFGDDRLLIEKYLIWPRHIEVQVFADSQGNAVHLFERDCSVQRRHQKVLEEAPAPNLDPGIRAAMGEAAVSAAKAIGYVGAGTVEFIMDDTGFYFMEMNTRLQVEHPVTELITGLDLVEWQLLVAAGGRLPLLQDDIVETGHAFEARLYAEDPFDFRPQTGRISHLRFPGSPARVDTGVRRDDTVSIHYDPMIAKLIVHGRDRKEALGRMSAALAETEVGGLVTNQPFLARLAAHPAFAAAEVHTGFINQHAADLTPENPGVSATMLALASLAWSCRRSVQALERGSTSSDPSSPWHGVGGWRLNEPAILIFVLDVNDERSVVKLRACDDGYEMIEPMAGMKIRGQIDELGCLVAMIDGASITAGLSFDGDAVTLFGSEDPIVAILIDPLEAVGEMEAAGGRLTAPMPGKIISVHASDGDFVERGAPLVVLEAMKMEHTISAPSDGTVTMFHYAAGDLVEEGADLLDFEPAEEV
ncbi:MAG: acetyl/propionyl/methylcrotonyl-CoA carboxylase subunit alpha [Alphaproteobacteria bacterium]|nr:acetyl/propionyl/methylcrotonyl-CoA carboxylase subunit alpha [Alphaproteobacteria bacterium]